MSRRDETDHTHSTEAATVVRVSSRLVHRRRIYDMPMPSSSATFAAWPHFNHWIDHHHTSLLSLSLFAIKMGWKDVGGMGTLMATRMGHRWLVARSSFAYVLSLMLLLLSIWNIIVPHGIRDQQRSVYSVMIWCSAHGLAWLGVNSMNRVRWRCSLLTAPFTVCWSLWRDFFAHVITHSSWHTMARSANLAPDLVTHAHMHMH